MSRSRIQDIEKELEKLNREKTNLELALQQEPESYLAEILHNKLCHHNHTDSCDWFYPSSNAKERYLTRCRLMLQLLNNWCETSITVEEMAEKLILILTGDKDE